MNKKNNRIAILLTASIAPNGMLYTALQNPSIRLTQYITAVKFYLQHTNTLIVLAENTNTYSEELLTIQNKYKSRFEYLSFDGNNYNKELGKGYGEAIIIKYALEKSDILKQCTYILKITGRLIIENINEIISTQYIKHTDKAIRFDFCTDNSIYSMCFLFPKKWMINEFLPFINYINDKNNNFFEHLLYKTILASNYLYIVPFTAPPQIKGISGSSLKEYTTKSLLCNLADNFFFLSSLYKKKNRNVISQLLLLGYYFIIFITKIHNKFQK